MSTHTILAVLAVAGILAGFAGLGLAVDARRQVGKLRGMAHRHDRRPRDPATLPEKAPERSRHAHPDDARSTRREAEALRRGDDPPTYPPRPTPYPRDDEEVAVQQHADGTRALPPTARHAEPETTVHAPPTTDMRTLPPPGSIRNDR